MTAEPITGSEMDWSFAPLHQSDPPWEMIVTLQASEELYFRHPDGLGGTVSRDHASAHHLCPILVAIKGCDRKPAAH